MTQTNIVVLALSVQGQERQLETLWQRRWINFLAAGRGQAILLSPSYSPQHSALLLYAVLHIAGVQDKLSEELCVQLWHSTILPADEKNSHSNTPHHGQSLNCPYPYQQLATDISSPVPQPHTGTPTTIQMLRKETLVGRLNKPRC